DNEGYNSFWQHFRIKLVTFNTIVAKLEAHSAFSYEAPNSILFANRTGIRILEQTLRISQESVCHFTDRFLKALLDIEQGKIMWSQGSKLATITQGFEHGISGLENNLPNIIGVMDKSHIPIHLSSKNSF
ncbi:3124_t:CDS:2, partial [Cetraspora pellucida]